MANFNKVILAGNLTRDPQLSSLPSGMAVCELGMAINDKWRDKNSNEMRERTCFVDLRAYGRQAETLSQYMSKGKPLLVEGRLQFDQWEAKDGSGKRSKLYVVVMGFQFLGAPDGQRSEDRGAGSNEMPPLDSSDAGGDNIPF
jgi:single-strand DNA-binding protein